MSKAVILQNNQKRVVQFRAPTRLTALLPELSKPCGGRGFCGRCRVRVEGKTSAPTAEERAKLTAAKLRDGVRLACQTQLLGDVTITLPNTAQPPKADVGTPVLKKPLGRSCGFALDLGTTTMCGALYDLQNGSRIAYASAANPQTTMGADVLTRMEYALQGHGGELCRVVQNALFDLCASLLMQARLAPGDVDAAVLVGNTAMLYLLFDLSPASISSAPFRCDMLFGDFYPADFLPVRRGTKLFVPRCISAFLGADAAAAALSCGMDKSCRRMLADLGTNGEILLRNGDTLVGCSCAAGPAFEGVGLSCAMPAAEGAVCSVMLSGGRMIYETVNRRPPAGICGSGYVDWISCLRRGGFLKKDGALEQARVYLADTPLYITQKDVRAFQLAKSAVRTGMEYVSETAANSELESLEIAGSFGTALRVRSAAQIGLIPPRWTAVAHAAGNAAGTGSAMLLLDEACIERVHSLAIQTKTISLADKPDFNERLCQYLTLE